jgi:hypothetical protein
VRSDLVALLNEFNGNIDNANIKAGANIDGAKLLAASILTSKLDSAVTVAALPGAPYDGQEINYLADATNGVLWRLKYRAASASAYKWEFVGGGYLYSTNIGASGVTGTGTGFADLSGGTGPDVTVPLAGDYEADFGAEAFNTTAATSVVNLGVGLTGSAGPTFAPVITAAMGSIGGSHIGRAQAVGVLPNLTAGLVVRMRYLYVAISTITYQNRQFRIRPRRVG